MKNTVRAHSQNTSDFLKEQAVSINNGELKDILTAIQKMQNTVEKTNTISQLVNAYYHNIAHSLNPHLDDESDRKFSTSVSILSANMAEELDEAFDRLESATKPLWHYEAAPAKG